MLNKWCKYLLGILFLFASLFANSQNRLRYEVFTLGKKIGEMNVMQTDSAGEKHYVLNGITDFKILWWELKATLAVRTVIGKDGLLRSSSLFAQRKDKTGFSVSAIRNGNKIEVNENGKKRSVSGFPIFAQLPLYFNEPVNISQLFSERTGEFAEVVCVGNHCYKAPIMSLTGTYTYENGLLTNVEASSAIGKLHMKLVK